MKATPLILSLASAVFFTPAGAQYIPIATTTQVELVPHTGGGSQNYGVRSSMKLHPLTGQPGIAHFDMAGKQLIYTAWNGTAWAEQVVATYSNNGNTNVLDGWFHCSLAYDAAGVPAIAYYDRDTHGLKFARHNAAGNGWITTSVDPLDADDGDVGRYCSLDYAPNGKAYVSYYHHQVNYTAPGTAQLRVATRSTSGVWSTETVDAVGNVGQWSSLAIDGNGLPAVSYYNETLTRPQLVRHNGVAWSMTPLTYSGNSGTYTSITFNAAGDLAIAWRNETNGSLEVYQRLPLGVYDQALVDGSTSCYAPSLAYDRSGGLVVSYYNSTLGTIQLATSRTTNTGNGLAWSSCNIDGRYVKGMGSSLVIGQDGKASVCFGAGGLVLAKLTGWSSDVIQVAGGLYASPSLSHSPAGQPVVSYNNQMTEPIEASYSLRVARRDPSLAARWYYQSIAPSGNNSALSHGPSGSQGLAYFQEGTPKLIYREGNPATEQILTTTDRVASPISSAYGPDGEPVLSYVDANTGALRYAERTANQTWTIQTLDTALGAADHFTSLAFAPEGQPAICYFNRTTSLLRYAKRLINGTWSLQTIDSTGTAGQYCSLSYGPNGRPAVSYQDSTQQDLKYAEQTHDGNWSLQTVASTEDTGYHISLAFGPAGRPVITYNTYQNFAQPTLNYAERAANGSWSFQNIDSQHLVSGTTSVAFDASGRPTLAYLYTLDPLFPYQAVAYAEQIISPSPTPAVPFALVGYTHDPASQRSTLAWQGLPTSKYQIDASTTLAPGSWQTIGDDIPALDGTTFFRTSSLPGPAPAQRFFRVKKK